MKYFIVLILAIPAFGAPLQSNPLAPYVLWMDGRNWTATPEQQQATFDVVAHLYSPFNLNVLLGGDPGDRADVARVIIGGVSPIPGAAGQSPVGVWHFGTLYRAFGDAFTGAVYADSIGNDPTLTGVAVAHEAGHLFGEFHTPDGVMAPNLSGLIPDPAWPAEINVNGVFQDTYAELGGQLGFAPVPEPPVLLLMLLMLMRRTPKPSPKPMGSAFGWGVRERWMRRYNRTRIKRSKLPRFVLRKGDGMVSALFRGARKRCAAVCAKVRMIHVGVFAGWADHPRIISRLGGRR